MQNSRYHELIFFNFAKIKLKLMDNYKSIVQICFADCILLRAMSSMLKCLYNGKISLLVLIIFGVTHGTAFSEELYLERFYGSGSLKYEWAFGGDLSCNPLIKASGILSPTKPAVRGLEAVFRGELEVARECERQLNRFSSEKLGGIFFNFQQNYMDRWPFHMRAPWVSALTQGVALGFYLAMAKKTGEAYYVSRAKGIFESFMLPLEIGGFARVVPEGIILEEYPVATSIAVLNGGLVAAIALKDYATWSGDERALKLFESAYIWFEKNIARYDILNSSGKHVPAYSLAPHRLDVLFRFVMGTEMMEVDSIAVQPNSLGRFFIPVGDEGKDHESEEDASLIVSPKMNWSNTKRVLNRDIREIIPGLGEFDHAPFRIQVASPEMLAGWRRGASMEIVYRGRGQIDLQISDGIQFHKIGTLPPSPREFRMVILNIPDQAIAGLAFSKNSTENNLYEDYSRLLTNILADIKNSEELRKYSTRWNYKN